MAAEWKPKVCYLLFIFYNFLLSLPLFKFLLYEKCQRLYEPFSSSSRGRFYCLNAFRGWGKFRRDFTTFYDFMQRRKMLRRTEQGQRWFEYARMKKNPRSSDSRKRWRNRPFSFSQPLWSGNSKCHQHNLILARERTSANRRTSESTKRRNEMRIYCFPPFSGEPKVGC